MTRDLASLYRDQVLRHSKSPSGRGEPGEFDVSARGNNPLCGDRLSVFIKHDATSGMQVFFEGSGCAISVASASMMTQMLAGKDAGSATEKIEQVVRMLRSSLDQEIEPGLADSAVAALSGVRQYPSRVKCAELAWQAASAALRGHDLVTTESNG